MRRRKQEIISPEEMKVIEAIDALDDRARVRFEYALDEAENNPDPDIRRISGKMVAYLLKGSPPITTKLTPEEEAKVREVLSRDEEGMKERLGEWIKASEELKAKSNAA